MTREFITQDGNRIRLSEQSDVVAHGYQCECHRRMGNDFWFLPTGSCLRDDKTCPRSNR